jgi:putative peptide zinc metalloprotease protein
LDAVSGVNTLPDLAAVPLARRPELLLCPLGSEGQCVVKDGRSGAYYRLGEQEAFLLARLDGEQTPAAICTAFEERFGEPLPLEDLREFLEMAQAQGFLQASPRAEVRTRARQSILYWRISLLDPDRLFTWLEPKIGLLWSRAFLLISLIGIVAAVALVWTSRQELAISFVRAWRWETVVLAWLLVAVLTTCHEFAHGLTCKHYGGEVHEVGFLLLFFMPCFYCNVSDAWLIREKSKRLGVTLAGGYCDLCLGALAAFAWRLTLPGSLPSYLAWVALTILGARVFFNFNPLLKLDGYYLLSDALELPNLRQRAWERVMGQLRRLLWGAPRPAAEAQGKFLLLYGAVSWLFSLAFLVFMIVGFSRFLGACWGLAGAAVAGLLGVIAFRGMFQGFAAGEIGKMIRRRWKRTLVWILILAAVPALLYLVEIEDRASGPFQIRPVSRAEVRAPVAGFLQAVSFDEGDRVYAGSILARLEVPDLASRLRQKQAQIREARAQLRLLEIGPRPEKVLEQRHYVKRAEKWRDLAELDLRRTRNALHQELERLDQQIAQYRAERDHAQALLTRAQQLRNQSAVSAEEYQTAQKQCRVSKSLEDQARARKRERLALGCLDSEAELARREKELADAQATLTLLEAGSRPEEIEAERARLARLEEEDRYLKGLQEKELVRCPIAGLITTPHLKEKIGRYLQEGELICEVEEPAQLQVEIALAEQDVARVRSGQLVELKARSLPFQTFRARVERVAPRAVEVQSPLNPVARGEAPGTVTVYCRPELA